MPIPNDPIKHVVVLMLENRSFDHMLGDLRQINPAVNGIDRNNPGSNPYPGNGRVAQTNNALAALPRKFDPKHEYPDVVTQLGDLSDPVKAMQGFVQDAVDTHQDVADENTIKQVMSYFPFGTSATDPMPALHTLAQNFTVCDQWFSSVPGPTWPNRFFALTGTCAGHLRMPGGITDIGLLFKSYDMPTIFNRLLDKGRTCVIYHDGASLASLLKQTLNHADLYQGMNDFDIATEGPERDFPEFAFIEPQYFNVFSSHENDQHPPHDVRYGDRLVAHVYNKIRANTQGLWGSTLLVILYDEHGGFYDHVPPPPGIAPDTIVGDFGFDYKQLGVRVPAILVSPYVKAGGVDHTVYDHTSLLKYLCNKWDLAPLGERCRQANSFESQLTNALNPAAPAQVVQPVIQQTRALQPGSVPFNENQRALSLMVDFLTEYVDGTNPASALRGIERGDPDAAENVLRKADHVMSRLKAIAQPAPQGRPQTVMPAAADVEPRAAVARQPLRVFMVHGVGHGDDPRNQEWKALWEQAFRSSAAAAGHANASTIEFVFANYDEIFQHFPLDPVTVMRGIAILGHDVFGPAPSFGTRDLIQKGLLSVIRWTAGMTLQWIENADLRGALRTTILSQFQNSGCDIVCAHSLGAMACYDAFRREMVKSGENNLNQAEQFNNKYFLTFGTQLAHPAVQSVFGGRIEPLYDEDGNGFAQWFHLYNPHDAVFTRPLPGEDRRTHSLTADFDIPGDPLNHDGDWYLNHSTTRTAVMPQILQQPAMRTLNTPAVIVARTSKRRAVLVGINDYPDPSMRLNGCINDVYLMSSVLQECGFEAGDIRLLTDRRATRAALLERLDWLSDGTTAGDERVFFYSGHGAQMPALGATDEPDHQVETLVPADFDWSREHAFTDREFHEYYSHLPYEAEFLSIFDCCHAGGMARGGQRVRGIDPPDDIRHRELRWSPQRQMWVPRDFAEAASNNGRSFRHRPPGPGGQAADLRKQAKTDALETGSRGANQVGQDQYSGRDKWVVAARRGLGEAGALRLKSRAMFDAATRSYGHKGPYAPILIFAARENELAAEYEHGSVSYGAFTFTMAKRLRQFRRAPTFSNLLRGVRQELKELGYQQTPEASGPSRKLDGQVPVGRWREGQ